ncbi:MAG: hypothetical protein SVU32_04265 [Candidatus Nanohaloarchaea archaeon]|nr:hypothetical protein [Candidatus Nanohaloarchaea archaeon]
MSIHPVLQETYLSLVIIGILYLIYRFEDQWSGRAYYCTTMMKLNHRPTLAAFAVLIGANTAAFAGPLLIALQQPRLATLAFNIGILLWTVFLYLLDKAIHQGGVPW